MKATLKVFLDLNLEFLKFSIKSIHPDIRETVYCTALKIKGNETWIKLWKKYDDEEFSSEKRTILQALGCTNDTKLITVSMIDFVLVQRIPIHIDLLNLTGIPGKAINR